MGIQRLACATAAHAVRWIGVVDIAIVAESFNTLIAATVSRAARLMAAKAARIRSRGPCSAALAAWLASRAAPASKLVGTDNRPSWRSQTHTQLACQFLDRLCACKSSRRAGAILEALAQGCELRPPSVSAKDDAERLAQRSMSLGAVNVLQLYMNRSENQNLGTHTVVWIQYARTSKQNRVSIHTAAT